MIFPEEIVKHFDICNSYEYAGIDEFYDIKTMVLRDYASFLGYDLQIFEKGTIKDFQIDEVFTVTDYEYRKYYFNKERYGISDWRWVSKHRHILERYAMHSSVDKSKIFHIPTREFFFTCQKYEKKSDRYDELADLCPRVVGQKLLKRTRKNSPNPHHSLECIKKWISENNVVKKQIEIFEEVA